MDTTAATETASSSNLEALNAKLQQASEAAMTLVHQFAAVDPPGGSDDDATENDNCWNNPTDMFQQLKKARDALSEAWRDYQEAFEKVEQQKQKNENSKDGTADTPDMQEDEEQQKRFRVMYMDMITDAFGDVLNEMREKNEQDVDINTLVDCLQSGIDFLDDADKKNALQYFDSFREEEEEEENNDDQQKIPIHQLRQLELGYPPVTAAET